MSGYEVPTSRKDCKWKFEGFTKNPKYITILATIESIVVKLPTGEKGQIEIWKYSRYFKNSPSNAETSIPPPANGIELYNITRDPHETKNLTHPAFSTPESVMIEALLEQRWKK